MVQGGGKTGMAAALAMAIFITFSVLAVNCAAAECSRTCVTQNCDSIRLRYGKYCGVGHTGCRGEPPCDDVDACCRVHDECTGIKGVTSIKCHQQLIRCVKRARKSRKPGFSRVCPVSTIVPAIIRGMNMAILGSSFGSGAGIV
ncbi:hypothetical protein Tsubulata_003114 [Turnera subulata]|uniref:Phospholipase A(2) n=1 Tax=Turnera subulata TaxID=218843 RepID=A0A9Q0JF03_9ROSI|nr:hypothetical protein Tsubulata_003114 [Turnera subulata]